ncbi:MAG TPA: glycosyltransferase [Candidatus Binataceae bacterium]|nr:glycosyltransferase [Candidatus Binataceae bacterium]
MESHLEALCAELRGLIDLRVLVANDGARCDESVVNGITITRVGTPCKFAAAPICPGLIRQIRRARADLIHLHLPNPWAVMACLAADRRTPMVVTYHSDVVKQQVLGRMFEPWLRRILERCAAVIATSRAYVESSRTLTSYRDKCRIVPHGISISRFRRYDRVVAARIRERYGSRLVISVGRLVYYKGLDYLIRAMRAVEGRLLIVGEGPLRSSLEREARANGVEDRVVFLGDVDDVVPYYHAADLFVLPSIARSEAFGIVQLEAMICGKPVINTRLDSGVPFVSVDGATGITVAPANHEQLASSINSLLDDPARRALYGMAAQRRVRQEFTVARMAERTLQIYGEVMGVAIERPKSSRIAEPGNRAARYAGAMEVDSRLSAGASALRNSSVAPGR